jgi:F-type H+-transporting ATPase subunit delta
MRIKLLSRRYAQAVFDLAEDLKAVERVHKDLKLVQQVFNENRQLRAVINNPVLDTYKKVKVLKEILKNDLHELTLRFLLLITRKGRERYILPICESYDEIFNAYKNILSVKLTTAVEADAQLRKEVIAKMGLATKMNIELEEKTEEDLVGGFVLHFKDYQYDASIITQLNKLRSAFSHEHYIKKF